MDVGPRFSTGYGDARHLPTVLLENHSLKPYRAPVLGTYVYLESALRTAGKNGASLRQAIAADKAANAPTIPLAWEIDPKAPNETIDYKAIESRAVLSPISGTVRLEFTGRPLTQKVPIRRSNHVSASIKRPKAYWIPPAWSDVVQRLGLHGIQCERIAAAREIEVTSYRLDEMKFKARIPPTKPSPSRGTCKSPPSRSP